jgi:pyruvate/2-oxoglutarate dehydrogenase complex dihydrolipoamide dehydrogenase (E3) component
MRDRHHNPMEPHATLAVLGHPSDEQQIDGSDILVAVGRIPNTAGIGLNEVGIELDGRG